MRSFVCILAVVMLAVSWAGAQDSMESAPSGQTFIISGSTGMADVVMKGLPGDPVTDLGGRYSVELPNGWSGTVTPAREGYQFEPPSMSYTNVTWNITSQDYRAKIRTLTISGHAGLRGVVMRGLPNDPVTDENGHYAAEVAYGWSGVVTPTKEGYAFDPPRRAYDRLAGDENDQDYAPRVLMLTLSDRIVLGAEPIAGVTVTAQPGGVSDVTDAQGRYSLEVPYGWTGKVTIAKEGYVFNPPNLSYANLKTHMIDGVPESLTGTMTRRPRAMSRSRFRPQIASAPHRILVVPTTQINPVAFAEMTEDLGVMLHIVQEKLSEPRTIMGVLSDYGDYFGADGGQARAFYIQGMGVLLVMEVDFPLPSGGGSRVRVERQSDQPVDPVWQRAREKLYAPRGGLRPPVSETGQMTFEQLQNDLIEMLKHAANIRHVDPNEQVILTIVSQSEETYPVSAPNYGGPGYDAVGTSPYASGGSGGSSFNVRGGFAGSGAGSGSSLRAGVYGSGSTSNRVRRPIADPYASPGLDPLGQPVARSVAAAVLIIQAQKAHIDSFAKGESDLERFQEKVTTFTY